MPSVNIEFFSPDQSWRLSLVYDGIEEAMEHLHSIAIAKAREAGVIGQWLIQIIPQVPVHAEPICCVPHDIKSV